ncbi:MAG: DUF4886 domain-containing protein [Lentisphaeria bacterium]|nr:DUF4886 domain-containing protein [Lentisphaeria bacterium]
MKRLCLLLLSAICCALSAGELKVLTIGNSFSASAARSLPWVTASVPGCRIILTGANIGGCSLERHWEEWNKAEKDPQYKPYGVCFIDSAKLPGNIKYKRGNVNELIKNNKYDIITIQQNSANSWKYETYQPFAGNLIAVLKKYQPQAEIVIQQTWSYRCDSPRLKAWKIDNSVMYDKLAKAYGELAGKYGFRVIPCGDAVQIFRAATPVKFKAPDRKALALLKNKEAHAFDGEVVGMCKWTRHKKTKQFYLSCDTSHLNPHGEYMQGAVWFSVLFGRPATEVKYLPAGMTPEMQKFLLECARKAVENYRQPGK